ncbi:hypothetical protein FG167_07200 [Lacinutrix sp. WUR7]|uniref:SGNH/GDSL hydrolase family protein n=1 Tax=Lacinutrix sp. WUR7 TaxID=2653681 RepID=UPI00193DBBF9|nr:SGNH/GDSL hydrolase family protein [Lacinutrix sp. WUR7]QRM89030.1 hypothetical protein FG167_07200 [Lacinutrix sp. WUR7]
MQSKLKDIWIVLRNIGILLILLECILAAMYTYNDAKKYEHKIAGKIEAKVHDNMSATDTKTMYQEYNAIEMQWTPYLHYSHKPFQGKFNTINNLGQRKTTQHKVNDTLAPIKIFCFGGSTMYGIGTTDETTIPSILSNLLIKAFPDTNFEITNFGVQGYQRDMEAIQLSQEVLKNNIPDIAIFLDGVNEVLAAFNNNDAGIPTNAFNRNMEFNTIRSYSKRTQLFLKSSYTYRFVQYLRKKIATPKKSIDVTSLSKKIAANYRNHIIYSDPISANYNFKVFNFFQPTIFTKHILTDFEKTEKENASFKEALYEETYKIILEDSILKNTDSFIDLHLAFDNNSNTLFTDFCHTEEKGNTILAQEMVNVIKMEILNRKNTPLK